MLVSNTTLSKQEKEMSFIIKRKENLGKDSIYINFIEHFYFTDDVKHEIYY